MFINGEWCEASTGNSFDVVDPATGAVIGSMPDGTTADAERAIGAADAAFAEWSATTARERSDMLLRAWQIMTERAGELAELMTREQGKPLKAARNEVNYAADFLRYYSEEATRVAGEWLPSQRADQRFLILRQPVGVVAMVTPWNYPISMLTRKMCPALAAGCTTVIKPAPQDPLGIFLLGEAIDAAGFPPGVVNIVNGAGPEVPAALVDTRNVDMISFTGSTGVGAKIMENGGKTMKRLLMELGGKGAAIVTEDADIGVAAQAIATVWGFHSGQICTAPTRVIAHKDIYDQLVETLKTFAGFMPVGDPNADGTIVGPVITELHRDRVEAFIKSGTDAGATLVVGGERPELDGYYIAPTLLADCTPDMHVVREEAFGPVIVVMPYEDDDHAVALANDSDYGLYSYVFCGDTHRAYGIGQQLESGNVGLNVIQPHMEAPFGGFKMSGVGRDRGKWGVAAYSELQSINWIG